MIKLGPSPKPYVLSAFIIFGIVDSEVIETFDAMCRVKYWPRLWIIHEILFARRIRILWGDQEINQACIDFLTARIDKMLSTLMGQGMLEMRKNKMLYLLNPHSTNPPEHATPFTTFTKVLSLFGASNCSDPRDHVSGFYGLFPLAMKAQLQVDYSTEVVALLVQVLQLVAKEPRSDNEDGFGFASNLQFVLFMDELMKAMVPEKMAKKEVADTIREIQNPVANLLDDIGTPSDSPSWESAIEKIGALLMAS